MHNEGLRMINEKLKLKRALFCADKDDQREAILDKFFESNICIPKGENRHPYADVLHEWVEGKQIELFNDDHWVNIEDIKYPWHGDEYRIKPIEPIYEWQWYKIIDGKVVAYSNQDDFMTEDEAPDFWSKFEETRRIR